MALTALLIALEVSGLCGGSLGKPGGSALLFDDVEFQTSNTFPALLAHEHLVLRSNFACLEVSTTTVILKMDSGASNERSPLLGSRWTSPATASGALPGVRRRDSQPNDNELDSDTDEGTLNEMVAMFSTSVGPLGLGGAIQGAPMMRRGSISSIYAQQPRRRSRRYSQPVLPEDNATERGSCSNTTRVDGRSPSFSKSLNGTAKLHLIQSAEVGTPKRSEFLGGVSRARFWAVFSSILLVYLVSGTYVSCRV
jgi:hypothetical protein